MKAVMSLNPARTYFVVGLVLTSACVFGQQPVSIAPVSTKDHLSLTQVLANLQERCAQRAAALKQFEGTRVYRMEYRGFAGDRDAQMVVKVNFRAPNSKQFTVISQTGSRFVMDHVFKKLLESEEEFSASDNHQDGALSTQNYDFAMAGYEVTPDGGQYILSLSPKVKNKYLYQGKIWVDAKDFAVTRIEGEPARNPSMWIKKTEISHRYKNVDGFWLPAENHTESFIRLGGKATLSIDYQDYKIVKATPLETAKKMRQSSSTGLEGITAEDSIWPTRIAKRASH